jgi:dTDP-4-dehydrorhamnose 3,5-epimerase
MTSTYARPDLVSMTVQTTAIDGLLRITAKAVTDDRGTVREFFRTSSYDDVGIGTHGWRQVNLTWTARGAIRGLHGEATDKLVGIAHGEAMGAYVDARRNSPTFGRVVTESLTPGVQIYVPAGVCNGFQALSDPGCQYLYCFGEEWRPDMPGVAVNPLDPDLGIAWPIEPDPRDAAMMSAKDAAAAAFADL